MQIRQNCRIQTFLMNNYSTDFEQNQIFSPKCPLINFKFAKLRALRALLTRLIYAPCAPFSSALHALYA